MWDTQEKKQAEKLNHSGRSSVHLHRSSHDQCCDTWSFTARRLLWLSCPSKHPQLPTPLSTLAGITAGPGGAARAWSCRVLARRRAAPGRRACQRRVVEHRLRAITRAAGPAERWASPATRLTSGLLILPLRLERTGFWTNPSSFHVLRSSFGFHFRERWIPTCRKGLAPGRQNHRMFGVGTDLCGSPSPTPCWSRVTQSRLHSTFSRQVWNISREGDSTPSLGSLCQCSITLRGKKFFLIFSWNFLCFGLCPLPLVLSLGTTEKSLAPSSWHPPCRYF